MERATWPKALSADVVALPDFKVYLAKNLVKKDAVEKKLLMGAGRALGSLEVLCGDDQAQVEITDVKVIVGLYTSGQHERLLDLPLLHPNFDWTATTISGIVTYAQYHMKVMMDQSFKEDDAAPVEYKLALQALIDDCKSGYTKRCNEQSELSLAAKARRDLQSFKKMPKVPRLQAAVKDAYCTLKIIADKFKHDETLPRWARGAANVAVVGAISFDTFAGRKGEWERAEYHYLCEVLSSDQRFIVCKEHKTAKTYGDLAKKLTPGLFDALCMYSRLPRPDACRTFLVPVAEAAPSVCFPTCLRTFCKRYLPECEIHPTSNLVRKFFHKKLLGLTKDEEKLKEMMVVLDGHSRKVIGSASSFADRWKPFFKGLFLANIRFV